MDFRGLGEEAVRVRPMWSEESLPDDGDRQAFLDILGEVCGRMPWKCQAYCLIWSVKYSGPVDDCWDREVPFPEGQEEERHNYG